MTYIELLNSFWDSTRFDPCSSNEATMYLYLLHQCNIRRWINPFEFKTRNLEMMLGLSRTSIGAIRNTLKQRGLIDFTKGVGSGSAVYFIIGADVTNKEMYGKFCVKLQDTILDTNTVCVKSEDTMVDTTLDTILDTTVDTNVNPTYYIEEKRKKTKDKSPNGDKKRARTPAESGLFSEREISKLEPRGVKASQLSKFAPPTIEEVLDNFQQQRADMRLPDWENEALTFFNYYNSQDWVKSNGRKVSNWESLATDWIMRKERELKQTKQNERHSTNRRATAEDTLADEQYKLAERIISRRNRQTLPGDYGDGGEIP